MFVPQRHRDVIQSCVAVAALLVMNVAADADVKLPMIFSDHAVMQTGKAVNVWGWDTPGASVSVEIAGQSATANTAADGKWSVTLPQLKAGGPFAMTVKGTTTLRVDDVLVGEVWLCAGQSNMAMQIRGLHGEVEHADEVIAAADHPTLRMFVHDKPATLRDTAVPSKEAQSDRPGRWIVCTPKVATKFTAFGYFFGLQLQDELHTPVGLINTAVGGTTIEAWTSLEAQKAVPEIAPLLKDWEKKLSVYDPIAESEKANVARIAWLAARSQALDAKKPAPKAPLEADYKNLAANGPGGLFNVMIAPVIQYTVRGAVWYQGERNASGPFTALYGKQLETLINDWRGQAKDDFHFAIIQLPNYQKQQSQPSEDGGWGVWVREGQSKTRAQVKGTSMAVTIDLGGPTREFLHPQNKEAFAKRLSSVVLHDVYEKSDAANPTFHSAARVDTRMMLTFDTAQPLVSKGNGTKPLGFAIAGGDHKFVWANAEIIDGKIAVWSDKVLNPEAVRYDWAANPVGDLQTVNGIPCPPFRTDTWAPTGTASESSTD